MEGYERSRKVKEGQGRSWMVISHYWIIVSAPVPFLFLWTLDFGFWNWILDLDFELGFGTGLGLDNLLISKGVNILQSN